MFAWLARLACSNGMHGWRSLIVCHANRLRNTAVVQSCARICLPSCIPPKRFRHNLVKICDFGTNVCMVGTFGVLERHAWMALIDCLPCEPIEEHRSRAILRSYLPPIVHPT